MNLRLNNRYIVTLMSFSLFAYADVSGTVFQDLPVNGSSLNSYGVKDGNERGVAGITVTAYPEEVNTTTGDDGSWSLTTSSPTVRVEFSNIPPLSKRE